MIHDYLANGPEFTQFQRGIEVSANYHLHASTDNKNQAKAARAGWQQNNHKVNCLELLPSTIATYYEKVFKLPEIDLTVLPAYSFVLQFTFTLTQPYISRDEQGFYIIDNPVRKDKIFGLPCMASTSWKGSLRVTLWQCGYKEKDEDICRLFGNKKEDEIDEDLHAGHLYFFPTFFTHKGLEIINPQDRRLRSGKDPILFESVPKDTRGIFSLLYVPFDRIGMNEKETQAQVEKELKIVAQGIRAMFRTYGFGAKTSSGFGLADEAISGSLTLRMLLNEKQKKAESVAIPQPATSPLARYLERQDRLKPEYLTSEGAFRERSEAELKKMSKGDRQLYEKAENWWKRRSKEQTEETKVPEQIESAPPESLPPAQPVSWPRWEFNSFEQLTRVVENLVVQLKGDSEETQHE